MDLDRPIRADLLLGTVPGAAPFLRDDLRPLPGVTVTGGTDAQVRITLDGPLRPLHNLQSYSTLALILGSPDRVTEALLDRAGDLADLLGRTKIRFRIGAELPDRPALIDRITTDLTWENSPSDWDLNLTVEAGGIVAQLGAMFLTARLGELARMPASTTPVIADVMTRPSSAPATPSSTPSAAPPPSWSPPPAEPKPG
jgi:tRNA (guanine6-N2)-methyltransferase